jgi:hypothetical protein
MSSFDSGPAVSNCCLIPWHLFGELPRTEHTLMVVDRLVKSAFSVHLVEVGQDSLELVTVEAHV